MRIRTLVLGVAVAALAAFGAPGTAAAADGSVPPGCSTWREGEHLEVGRGACDSTVTRPWRLVFRTICGTFGSQWWQTQYSLVSPKEIIVPTFCRTFAPSIELMP